MSEVGMSVKEFESLIKSQVRDTATELGWNFDVAQDRGFAFQLWFARVVAAAEQTLETDPEDSLLYSGDLGFFSLRGGCRPIARYKGAG